MESITLKTPAGGILSVMACLQQFRAPNLVILLEQPCYFYCVMPSEQVNTLVQSFSRSRRSEINAAWALAQSMGDLLPLLAEVFPKVRKSEGRASILRYVGRFSRESEIAFKMGITATEDPAYAVRYCACALLAYSLRADALPVLSVLVKHADRRTSEDARAAIDAIRNKNQHFFLDRNHTGKIRMEYASV